MKILLINPRRYTRLDRDYNDGRYNPKPERTYQFPPTPLLYLSSLVPSHDEVQIVDECIDYFDRFIQCDGRHARRDFAQEKISGLITGLMYYSGDTSPEFKGQI